MCYQKCGKLAAKSIEGLEEMGKEANLPLAESVAIRHLFGA
jgi:hypothetical protein